MIRIAFLLLSFALCEAASAQSAPVDDLQDAASVATIEQVGVLNVATVAQTASSVALSQAGTSNETQIEQVGPGGHTIALRQDGGSLATILQTGEGNVLFGLAGEGTAAVQENSSVLMLMQNGADNRALMHQTSGAFASLTQTGVSNTITAMQSR